MALVRRPRIIALVTLAMLNAFTIAAGFSLTGLIGAHRALLAAPRVAAWPIVAPGTVLVPDGPSGLLPSRRGLAAGLSPLLASRALGPDVGAVVTEPASGDVLFSSGGSAFLTPASTTKLATSVAALTVLGPDARFTTRVLLGSGPGNVVLVGGGDPTLAAGRPPAADYPQPATLAALAEATARALRAAHIEAVRVGYDTSLYSGPGTAPGWDADDVATGNVTPVNALEVDQGRLTRRGRPEDADDPVNYRPRSQDSAVVAARAFAGLLAGDGIRVTGRPRPARAAPGAAELAKVASPPLSEIVEWMLIESNNDIAEALARNVAIATGRPASFAGGAAAVRATLGRLGAAAGVHTVDGSGLSHEDRITPAALARLIALAASPRQPQLRPIITGLPVAGFSGTLSSAEDRFVTTLSAPAVGLVRAKTGTLNHVRALAGVVVDKDGRLLAFAFMIDRVPARTMAAAAIILDRLAAVLAGCGCR